MKASNFVIVALLATMFHGVAPARAAAPGTAFDLVAETGAQVPGLPGVTFSAFGHPQVNTSGDVAFRALIEGVGVDGTNFETICARIGGELRVFVRPGATISNQPGLTLATLSPFFTLTADRDAIFIGQLRGEGVDLTNDGAVLLAKADGSMRILAREGDAIGATGLIIGRYAFSSYSPDAPLVAADENNNGEPDLVAFPSGSLVSTPGVPDSDVLTALYLRDGELRLAADNGHTFSPVGVSGLDRPIEVTFSAHSATNIIAGVWGVDGNGNVKPLATEGQAAPGGKTEFLFFRNVSFSRNGTEFAAIVSTLKPDGTAPSIYGAFKFAIGSSQPGELWDVRRIIQRGNSVPKVGVFNFPGDSIVMDPIFGNLVLGSILKPNKGALLAGTGHKLRFPIAIDGRRAPEDEKFGELFIYGAIRGVASRRALCSAKIKGEADQPDIDVLLVSDLGDRKASNQILVRNGETIDVGAAGTRTLTNIDFGLSNFPEAGGPTELNASGQICFLAGAGPKYEIILASTPPPVVHQPDIVVSSADGDIVQGRDVHELVPTQPQRYVVEMKRGETVDLKVSVRNNGTVDDSFDLSARMPAMSVQRQLGITSFSFITQVLDGSDDITGLMLHPKGKNKYATDVLASQAIRELTFRTTIPNDLTKDKLDKDDEIKVKLNAVSRQSPDTPKPVDTFDIVIRVTDPL
jgi:hypothetical protein